MPDAQRRELERLCLRHLGLTAKQIAEQIAEIAKVLPLVNALARESAPRNEVRRVLRDGAKDTPKGRSVREQFARTGGGMNARKREVAARLVEAQHREGMDDARVWAVAYRLFLREFTRTGQARQRALAQRVAILDRALRRGRAVRLAREVPGPNGCRRFRLDQRRYYPRRKGKESKAPLRRLEKALRVSSEPLSPYSEIMRVCLGANPERAIKRYKASVREQRKRI